MSVDSSGTTRFNCGACQVLWLQCGNLRAMRAARRRHMRYLITLVALTLTAGFLAACTESAQPKNDVTAAVAPAPESPEKIEAEIQQLEKDWVAAIVNKDFAVLDRILAADFNGTSPTGSTFPKERA